MKTYMLFALLSVGLVAGCSSVPRYQNQQDSVSSTVRCANPAPGGVATGEAFTYIEEIDRAPTGSIKGDTVYFVPPGKHQLALHVSTPDTQDAQLYCEFEAAPNRKYRVSAVRKNEKFFLGLVDETDPKTVRLVALSQAKARMGNVGWYAEE